MGTAGVSFCFLVLQGVPRRLMVMWMTGLVGTSHSHHQGVDRMGSVTNPRVGSRRHFPACPLI